MAEPHDPQLSQHYRDLEPLEPPTELDRAILAAGQRGASPRRRRWYYSLAAAAVLVFAVALTLQLERERPDTDSASPGGAARLTLSRELRGEIKPAERPAESKPAKVAPPAADAGAPASSRQESRVASASAPAPATRARRADAAAARSEAGNAQEAAPAAPPPEGPIQLRREMAIAPQAAPAAQEAQARARMAAPAAAPEPAEKWLERIAELRSRGRHAEADKALAEFRRAYPNYPLSDLMRERVEGR